MSRIWAHYASMTADRQSKHGISRFLIPRDPDGLELLRQPGAGTDGDCAWDFATASREKQKTDPVGPPLPIKLTNSSSRTAARPRFPASPPNGSTACFPRGRPR